MRRLTPAIAVLALLVLPALAAPPAEAQVPLNDLYSFQILAPETRAEVPVNGQTIIPLTFIDNSRDSPAAFNPAAPPNPVMVHSVSFEAIPQQADPGWNVYPPTSLITTGGKSYSIEAIFQATAQAQLDLYPVDFVATMRTQDGGVYTQNFTLIGFSLGAKSFSAVVSRSFQTQPNTVIEAPVRLINLGVNPRSFDMEVVENPCDMSVATSNNNLVNGKSEDTYTVSIKTPSGKLWYFSEQCTVTLQVSPTGQPDIYQQVYVSILVSGGYVNPVWVFQTLALAILLVILFILLARRKARIEEEILGKPQKPWTIPVEALYLKALKQRDERAWYVVRHYLMEDEYRSSILWYKDYKRATRGSRKKEGLVLRQEKAYERWKRQWQRKIARPLKQADRFEAQLQRKLDRKAAKAHRKQMGKYRKVAGKMKAAHAVQVERAGKQHAKAVAKAAKKGLPAPKRPVVPEPDYPDEPKPVAIPLSTHKWAKKAARFRAKAVRKQGDLEVKFEKADARRLRKVRRKVQKVARKLDDPDFVAEHPLLKAN